MVEYFVRRGVGVHDTVRCRRHKEKKVYPAPLARAASVRRRKLPCCYTGFGIGNYIARAGS